jgi:hypothetical protein
MDTLDTALDNLSAHHDEGVKKKLSDADVHPVFTPSQCTDVVAPGGHHAGERMKDAMRVMYEAEMDNNIENWEEGGLSAAERRIYIVTWVAEAWKVMQIMPVASVHQNGLCGCWRRTGQRKRTTFPFRTLAKTRCNDSRLL